MVFAASARSQVADFVSALFWVYSILLIAWLVAFGLFSHGGLLVGLAAAAALAALLTFFALNRTRRLAWLPTGLLIGGAAGNLIDRLHDKAVTDFIKLPLWPAFNIADVAITVG